MRSASTKVIPLRIGVTFLTRALEFPWFRPVAGAVRSGPMLRFSHGLATEIAAERDRWFPWAIACFGFGSILYFALSFEPPLWLALAILAMGSATSLAARGSGTLLPRFLCLCLAAVCFGFGAAKLRTEIVAAPVVTSDRGPVTTEGRIETVLMEDAANARIVLLPARIGDESENLPRRLRLTLRGEAAVASVAPGLNVSVLAMLRPPPEPALPGGYDFARWAFFEGIGGVGFVLGAPKPLGTVPDETWRTRFRDGVETLRRNMSARIQSVVPGSEGAIAAALITSERAAIPEEDNNAYRDSGLFHVLSISGVHMALAGLGIFWVVRAVLALSPGLALLYPIKKWAAVAAILAATFYLFLSGASAPAVRSWIMLLVMLAGVLADPPVLSMRSVAISAALILVFEPESIVEPSFQMSFAAIIGLIALAEWQRRLVPADSFPETSVGWVVRWLRRYIVGMLLASFVAGLATAPFAIFHFDRAPGYSLLANLLATPVVGVVIMPFACLAVALMPFGLDAFALRIMGWGVGMMTDIAHWVSSLPGAVNLVPAKPGYVLFLIAFGGLWFGLWQRRWRWLGMAFVASGIVAALFVRPPDILVSRDGSAIAVRGPAGALTIAGDLDDYTADQWLLRDGDARLSDEARAGARCDEWGCVLPDATGRNVVLALRPGALADDCNRAVVLVSAVPLRRPCPGPLHVIDRFDVYWLGAIALFFEEGRIVMHSAAEERGDRPWVLNPR